MEGTEQELFGRGGRVVAKQIAIIYFEVIITTNGWQVEIFFYHNRGVEAFISVFYSVFMIKLKNISI